jgi:MurNAc alpha-1-phosphate uridylyltransferase
MILAAGRGSRLQPLTDKLPKPMIEVQGKPLIERQVRQLAKAGIEHVVINLHHLGHIIEEHLGDGTDFNLRISYSREVELLETGGGVVNALPLLGEVPFWLLNGDIFTDFEFNQLPRQLPENSLMHLLLTPKPSFRERGDFAYADGWVTRRGDPFVYCGICVLDPQVLSARFSANSGAFSLRDLMFDAAEQQRLSAQLWTGYWIDIGSAEQLQQARDAVLS